MRCPYKKFYRTKIEKRIPIQQKKIINVKKSKVLKTMLLMNNSLIKHTCLMIYLLYYEHWTDKQKYFYV